ncbi:glycosyltransferase family 39 protein [Candidatus Dependentiae bacterium]|nr:glycosyltransferase family 39 protein [Candidatus Dependentiae bacterium]
MKYALLNRDIRAKKDTIFFMVCIGVYVLLSSVLYYAVPHISSHLDIDSLWYDKYAVHFFQTGSITAPHGPTAAPEHTIGYPLIMSLIYKVFGYTFTPIILIQIVCMIILMWALFNMTYRLFGPLSARIVAVLSILNVGVLVYPQFVLTETIVTCLIVLFLERFTKFWQTASRTVLVVSATFLGASLIVKPVALYFIPVVACFVPLYVSGMRKKFMAILLFLTIALAPLVGYMTRNKVLYNHFHFAPVVSINLYEWYLVKVIAAVHDITPSEAERMIPPFEAHNGLDENGWEPAKKLLLWYLAHHPYTCISVWMKNVMKTALGLFSTHLKLLLNPMLRGGDITFFSGTGSWWNKIVTYVSSGAPNRLVVAIAAAESMWSILRWLLIVSAGMLLWVRKRYAILAFFMLFVAYNLMITGHDGCGRYRFIIEPQLIMLTAFALAAWWDILMQRRVRELGVSVYNNYAPIPVVSYQSKSRER